MFTKLADQFANHFDRFDVFNLHPRQLQGFLEVLWESWRKNPNKTVPIAPHPGIGKLDGTKPITPVNSMLLSLDDEILSNGGTKIERETLRDLVIDILDENNQGNPAPDRFWPHLIYAYLVENTRVFDICQRLLHQIVSSEQLGSMSEASQRWARTTEMLFFRDGSASLIGSTASELRPDVRATRRNAYYRMFGMDLNHGTLDQRPYAYEKPKAANRDFVTTFESFLREVWRGYINSTNSAGVNMTDTAAIADLGSQLREMLLERRHNGNLTREEFSFVATMNWFHLTLGTGPDDEHNSPIVRDCKAEASSPDERLRRLGERVGVPAHRKARSLLTMAEPLSNILVMTERGDFDDPGEVGALYDSSLETGQAMLEIINHWSIATGHDIKATSVTSTGSA